jgi:hypothetical protein
MTCMHTLSVHQGLIFKLLSCLLGLDDDKYSFSKTARSYHEARKLIVICVDTLLLRFFFAV